VHLAVNHDRVKYNLLHLLLENEYAAVVGWRSFGAGRGRSRR
jgi:hypothetical protein